MPSPSSLDKEHWPPDYTSVFLWRQKQFLKLRSNDEFQAGAIEYYKTHPAEFITHWCDTYDPRNAFDDLPTRLPMVLYKRQADLVEFWMGCLRDQESGLVDKSRDTGVTWTGSAFSVWLWRFVPGAAIGWGSRKADLVDKLGDPDSIFEKMRVIIRGLPRFFWPRGFQFDDHVSYMKIVNPESGATITGEAGDNIGRGGRKLIYFKDESAHYEHPESIEAALMETTRVQIDISTVNGVGNVFDRKRQSGVVWSGSGREYEKGSTRVFVFDWRDHPAKNEEWYRTREKKAREEGLLHLFRQEVDRDATASLSGIIIKPEWVKAAVDAHIELGFGQTGGWSAGFDPYDEGGDSHAVSFRKGVVLLEVEDWGEGDAGEATRKVLGMTVGRTPLTIQYDCIGIGATVKSEANRLRADRKLPLGVTFAPWDAGGPPLHPKDRIIPGDSSSPLVEDFYYNVKAQAWWSLARRFERVYRMRTEKISFPSSELISISSKIPRLHQLQRELSQPTMKKSGDLRLLVDKKPEGAKSPNMADAVVMNFFPIKVPLIITQEAVDRSARR